MSVFASPEANEAGLGGGFESTFAQVVHTYRQRASGVEVGGDAVFAQGAASGPSTQRRRLKNLPGRPMAGSGADGRNGRREQTSIVHCQGDQTRSPFEQLVAAHSAYAFACTALRPTSERPSPDGADVLLCVGAPLSPVCLCRRPNAAFFCPCKLRVVVIFFCVCSCARYWPSLVQPGFR
jgi:hypothetical protein